MTRTATSRRCRRYGQTSSSGYGLIDNLAFTLTGNQLNRVDDAVTASAYNGGFEFKNGASAANEYAYDANGNLTKDSNKGISNISYNVLNLPGVVTFSDGSTVTYTYSAEGTKLRTVHKTGSEVAKTLRRISLSFCLLDVQMQEAPKKNLTGGLEYFYCITNNDCLHFSSQVLVFIIFRKITIQTWHDVRDVLGLRFGSLRKKYIK